MKIKSCLVSFQYIYLWFLLYFRMCSLCPPSTSHRSMARYICTHWKVFTLHPITPVPIFSVTDYFTVINWRRLLQAWSLRKFHNRYTQELKSGKYGGKEHSVPYRAEKLFEITRSPISALHYHNSISRMWTYYTLWREGSKHLRS
jgi:hypothetical protein